MPAIPNFFSSAGIVFAALVMTVMIFLYMFPAIIAMAQWKNNWPVIMAANILFWWTVIIWIILLTLALIPEKND